MDWETQPPTERIAEGGRDPLRKILGLILIRIQKLNVTRFQNAR